jgi:hypothetical protein
VIAFLASRRGQWTVFALSLPVTWVILTLGLGLDWGGSGNPVLIGLFAFILACGAYAMQQAVALVCDLLGMRQPARSARLQWQGPIPSLSPAKKAKVRRLHKAMLEAGVFAPEAPDPALAFAAFAVDRQPVDWVGVLQALAEAPYYHPELDPEGWEESWGANLLYAHVPAAWLTPPEGKVAAVLWEDGTIFLSLVNAGSMPALSEQVGRGASWEVLTADMLKPLAEAGVAVPQPAN